MSLLAIPNVSEGRDRRAVARIGDAFEAGGVRILDVHIDAVHNRTVLTASGSSGEIVTAATQLARACTEIDLTRHSGVHPRLGGLDVFPVVPHGVPIAEAVDCARAAAHAIGRRAGLPVYLYGAAAKRKATRELPDLRRGGLVRLMERASADLPPDEGPAAIDARLGVVCVGARGPLIAFNVVIEGSIEAARRIARDVREQGAGSGVRALAFATVSRHLSQVSMNLTTPERAGIDDALELVERAAQEYSSRAVTTEIVGLVEERFLPDPKKKAARLLVRPGRSVEAALRG